MRVISLLALCLAIAAAQEPVVLKTAVLTLPAERGNLPIFEPAEGSVSSIRPPRVVVAFSGTSADRCEPGRSARVHVAQTRALGGRVLQRSSEGPASGCEIELDGALPAGVGIGTAAGAQVEVDRVKDAVFIARPAGAAANTRATLFVVEPGGSYARRVAVRYGIVSGPSIQVLDGLAPGDRAILSDMSYWAKYTRVALR